MTLSALERRDASGQIFFFRRISVITLVPFELELTKSAGWVYFYGSATPPSQGGGARVLQVLGNHYLPTKYGTRSAFGVLFTKTRYINSLLLLLLLLLYGLTQSERIPNCNTWEGRVLRGEQCNCILHNNASHGLSAIAEFLVLFCGRFEIRA